MSYIFKQFILLFFALCLAGPLIAQKDSLTDISALIYLDSFVVTASKAGFDADDFIDMVRTDESFLEAFHNLRFISYQSSNEFRYFNKKGKEKASYKDIIQQSVIDTCRTMEFLNYNHQGNYFKRNKDRDYNYFTSEMHDRLFYSYRRICDSPKPNLVRSNSSRLEKYVFELKKLMFKPGEKANVPFIGDKTSIFEEPMIQYYDFKISSEHFDNHVDCYVFSAEVKPKYEGKNKVVIKNLKTYFDKSNFKVIGRDYQLAYSSGLYQFDVQMHVELTRLNGKYYPINITYDGFWNVPVKKREASKFQLQFFDFKTPGS